MITIYHAKDAKASADAFYGPLGQIFTYIKDKSKEGLYILQVSGVELNSKQIEVLKNCGYVVEQSVDEKDKTVYSVSWE